MVKTEVRNRKWICINSWYWYRCHFKILSFLTNFHSCLHLLMASNSTSTCLEFYYQSSFIPLILLELHSTINKLGPIEMPAVNIKYENWYVWILLNTTLIKFTKPCRLNYIKQLFSNRWKRLWCQNPALFYPKNKFPTRLWHTLSSILF